MKTVSDSSDEHTLDALLDLAPRHTPPAGFADRVLAALHEEEAAELATPISARTLPRPWYRNPYGWSSAAAAAACLALGLFLMPLIGQNDSLQADALAVDDAILVEEALDSIDDPDLISAICSVSLGTYSLTTGGGGFPQN